jgi:hypothetical protein
MLRAVSSVTVLKVINICLFWIQPLISQTAFFNHSISSGMSVGVNCFFTSADCNRIIESMPQQLRRYYYYYSWIKNFLRVFGYRTVNWACRRSYLSYVEESRPPLWSSGQRSGFDSRRYQIFWEAVSLHSLVSTIEELIERKSSGSGLEKRNYGRRNPSRRPRGSLFP